MRRAVILTTLTLLLLAVTGITMAGESTFGPEWGSEPESTVQDLATTTGEPTATTIREPTVTTDEVPAQTAKPGTRGVTKDSTAPEADEPEITEEPEVIEEQAAGGEGDNIGRPEGVGKPEGVGGKHLGNGKIKGEERQVNGGEDQDKVTLCHKDTRTLTVGEPAVAAHLEQHEGDALGSCQTERVAPESSEEKPRPGAAQNGGGGDSHGQQKVALCHKGKTLTVGEPANEAHLDHGDTLGACE